MKFIERILFYPVLVIITVLVLMQVTEHGGTPAYVALGGVAAMWGLSFVRSMLWVVRVLFWLSAVVLVVGAVWLSGWR